MPSTPATRPSRPEPPHRGHGDACPGALRLHRADDGSLARVRLPGGLLSSRQAELLADVAEELGDGHLDVTSRGNVQMRGLSAECGGELADRLRAAGLLPSDSHERVRNVVASPLAGLDGAGHADVQHWARELDALLCADPDAAGLSGRFLFALDDGRLDVAALDADVTIIAARDGTAELRTGAGGALTDTSRDAPRDAPRDASPDTSSDVRLGASPDAPLDARFGARLRIAAGDAPRAAVAAAGAFLAAAAASGNGAWRVRDLPAGHGLREAALAGRLTRAGIAAEPAGGAPAPPGAPPPPGLVEGPDGRFALSVAAPLGRFTAHQWRLLAAAAREGAAELRMTPWRGAVLPGLSRDSAPARLGQLADAGLVTTPASPWHGVGACTGLPGCAKSLADVRTDAAGAVAADAVARTAGADGAASDGAARAGSGGAVALLPVHWSGCERRCGRPGGAWVDVLATGDGYRVTVNGVPPSGGTAAGTGADASNDASADRTAGGPGGRTAARAAARAVVPEHSLSRPEQTAGAVAAARDTR